MPKSIKEVQSSNQEVYQVPDEGWAFMCLVPLIPNSPRLCGFRSTEWPSKALAEKRAAQHQNEHETGELMPAPLTLLADDEKAAR